MNMANIKTRLKAAGRTQKQLADYLGIAPGEVSKYLNGKHKMNAERYLRVEAFLAEAERGAAMSGVAEPTRAPFAHRPTLRSIAVEEAKALRGKPTRKLSAEEMERIKGELLELGAAMRALPRLTDISDDDLLGYTDDDA